MNYQRGVLWIVILLRLLQTGLSYSVNNNDTSCEPSYAMCSDGQECIPQEQVCDYAFHCADYSDETRCSCDHDQFRCISPSNCIPIQWQCDGENDCNDGSDETGCPCADDQFSCADDGFCLANINRCDGVVNCNDISDELDCATCQGSSTKCADGICRIECEGMTGNQCSVDQFQCEEDSKCIELSKQCDDVADCSGSSDEKNCTCQQDWFRCNNGRCISAEHVCDNVVDCSDKSDEINCNCMADHIQCDDGRCVRKESLCDEFNCIQNTHGCVCQDDEFHCTNSDTCISNSNVCDGHDNCEDLSDELNCDVNPCGRYQKECLQGYGCYTEHDEMCDGVNDCGDGSDELDCDYVHTCPDGRRLRALYMCDGETHCADASDENNCTFTCYDGTEMPKYFKCDSRYDCGDSSDERVCNCHDNGRCPNGLCVAINGICDGVSFCDGAWDERSCPCNNATQFTCVNGLCVDILFVCDGINQCGDFSDENTIGCNCTEETFKCKCGMCVPQHKRCDGTPQCPDGTDELECDCLADQYQCKDGTCINNNWVCDLDSNCPDGSDESECGCTIHEFTCSDGSCVQDIYKCNGRIDCHTDSSDEFNCTCGQGEFHCLNGQCIDIRLKCDSTNDCDDSSDESSCNCSTIEFMCGDGKCIPMSHRCNNRIDCKDGFDEVDCICKEHEFHCHNGVCVPGAFVCDLIKDCADGSDEMHCKCKADEFRCSNRMCIAKNQTNDLCEDDVIPNHKPTQETIRDTSVETSIIATSITIILSVFGLSFLIIVIVLVKYTAVIKQWLSAVFGFGQSSHPPVSQHRFISLPVRDLSYIKHEIDRKKLEIGEMLGHGKFGIVHFGNLLLSNSTILPVAVKTIRLTASQAQKEDFLDEIKLMINIGRHQNIISMLGCCISDEPYLLITELMEYGDLLSFLRKCKMVKQGYNMNDPIYSIENIDILNIARQVARGMDYLSKTRYYHGDLAARNILVGKQMTIKISDFGLADDIYLRGYKRLAPDRKRPIAWVSLETILDGLCTIKSDVWSYGILLYEVVTFGLPPYPGIALENVIDELKNGYRMPKPEGCRDELYAVMRKCWQTKPSARPTFGDIYTIIDTMIQNHTSECYYMDCTELGTSDSH